MVNVQMSFLSPPFGYALFYLRDVAPPEIPTVDIFRSALPFLGIQVVALALCMAFPEIISPGCRAWYMAEPSGPATAP